MAYPRGEKKKLLHRVRRIKGQLAAIERGIDQDAESSEVLHNIAACRGAMDALMARVIEGHVRFHILDSRPRKGRLKAADDLASALRAYLR